jgi:AraC-like DNA-binding protein
MQVTVIAPSARLAPFVARFTIVEARDEVTRVLLPEQGLTLGVRFAGAASLVSAAGATRVADAAISGVQGAVRRMRTHAGGGIVLAMFRPAAAARMFAAPLHELFGQTLALDVLVARVEVARLAAQVGDAPDHAGRVAVLEAFLAPRLTAPADPIVAAAVRAIEGTRGRVRISALADALGLSQDPLEKRFRRAVGASPKQLASLVRVRHAITAGTAGAPWSRVAHEAGYFDQSHFIREFRAVTGEAPTRFFRDTEYC